MKLAIKGRATRGKEIIQLLEMLGGVNKHQIGAIRQTYIYFVDEDGIIRLLQINQLLPEQYIVYSLEEFEEKFPYKVGNKVDLNGVGVEITGIYWLDNTISYEGKSIKLGSEYDCLSVQDLKPLIENNDLQPYKESKCLQELKEYLDNAAPEQLEEDWKELEKFSGVGPVADEYVKQCKEGVNLQQLERQLDEALAKETPESLNEWLDEENMNTNNLCTRCVYAVDNHCGLRGFTNDFNRPYCSARNTDKLPNGFELQPDGYFSWVDSKPQYPKTYDECCDVLGVPNDERYVEVDNPVFQNKLIESFTELLICRNAYWKIAGDFEEKRKGKAIHNVICSTLLGEVKKDTMPNCIANYLLDFPTEEMRDAFYENFKELIAECKELL